MNGVDVISSGLPMLGWSTIVSNGIRGLMGLLAVLIISKIMWSWFLLQTHGGNEDRKHSAEESMKHAVAGLVIVASSASLVQFIVHRLFTLSGLDS